MLVCIPLRRVRLLAGLLAAETKLTPKCPISPWAAKLLEVRSLPSLLQTSLVALLPSGPPTLNIPDSELLT